MHVAMCRGASLIYIAYQPANGRCPTVVELRGVSIMVSCYVDHNHLIYHMKHRRAVDMLNSGLGPQSAIWHINRPSMLYKIHTVATYNC